MSVQNLYCSFHVWITLSSLAFSVVFMICELTERLLSTRRTASYLVPPPWISLWVVRIFKDLWRLIVLITHHRELNILTCDLKDDLGILTFVFSVHLIFKLSLIWIKSFLWNDQLLKAAKENLNILVTEKKTIVCPTSCFSELPTSSLHRAPAFYRV